jgi:hypothetical protein
LEHRVPLSRTRIRRATTFSNIVVLHGPGVKMWFVTLGKLDLGSALIYAFQHRKLCVFREAIVRYFYGAALAASVVGLVTSIVVHIRSLLGFGFSHWIGLFELMFVLFFPYLLACHGIIFGGVTRLRQSSSVFFNDTSDQKNSLALDLFEYQERWSNALDRRPTWTKILDYLVLGYFFTVFAICFFLKGQRLEVAILFSLKTLPAPLVYFFSSCWVLCYWLMFTTFWRLMFRAPK